MAGNVFEWCWDWYGVPYAGGTDPRGPSSPDPNLLRSYRVLRGGAWYDSARFCRTAHRFIGHPAGHNNYFGIGFRSVLSSGQ